jgi:hypothetical protein
MATRTLEAVMVARSVEIDSCPRCRLFWFDQRESIGLSPRAVLELFEYIGRTSPHDADPPMPLASRFSCPRCQMALQPTRDLQRTTHFTYWRCDWNHGRLITYNQFLREKNFVREPSPAELARLRATVRQVSCSQCGGPINLASDTGCSHCGSPIALIDPDSIAKAIDELSVANNRLHPSAADETTRARMIDAMLALERQRAHGEREERTDLMRVGVEAIGALVAAFLARD